MVVPPILRRLVRVIERATFVTAVALLLLMLVLRIWSPCVKLRSELPSPDGRYKAKILHTGGCGGATTRWYVSVELEGATSIFAGSEEVLVASPALDPKIEWHGQRLVIRLCDSPEVHREIVKRVITLGYVPIDYPNATCLQ
jgi:hypothetical protein